MALVGFFDILGTKDAVINDQFGDLVALDFVGHVGLAAKHFPSLRFAVFSDSVIVSANEEEDLLFLQAVQYMYGQWYADFIFVRGGIADGEIRWVDYKPADELFNACSNLMYARIYGKGLVIANEIEQRSGSGAITFLTESAANRLSAINPNSVLPGTTPMLCWASEREASMLVGYLKIHLEHMPNNGPGRRHALATLYYWEQVLSQKKFLPDFNQLQSG